MKFIIMEKRTSGRYEQVKFYDTFVSHYTEEDGSVSRVQHTYTFLGMDRDKCKFEYLCAGFEEVTE